MFLFESCNFGDEAADRARRNAELRRAEMADWNGARDSFMDRFFSLVEKVKMNNATKSDFVGCFLYDMEGERSLLRGILSNLSKYVNYPHSLPSDSRDKTLEGVRYWLRLTNFRNEVETALEYLFRVLKPEQLKKEVAERDRYGATIMHYLAREDGKLDVVGGGNIVPTIRCTFAELLIEAGADVNAQDARGEAPLHLIGRGWRSESGCHPQFAKLLLLHGADPLLQSASMETPVQVAKENRGGMREDLKNMFTRSIHLRKSGNEVYRVLRKAAKQGMAGKADKRPLQGRRAMGGL